MDKIKQVWQASDRLAIYLALGFGLVGTALAAKLLTAVPIALMGGYLVLVGIGLSIWLGRRLVNRRGWMLYWFPLAYLISAYEFLPRYDLVFFVIYLGVSYLTWALTRDA